MHTHLVLTVIVLMSIVPGGSITYTSAIHRGGYRNKRKGGGGSSMKNGGGKHGCKFGRMPYVIVHRRGGSTPPPPHTHPKSAPGIAKKKKKVLDNCGPQLRLTFNCYWYVVLVFLGTGRDK